MNTYNIATILLTSLLLTSCATNTYIEPNNSGQTPAVIKTQDPGFLKSTLGGLVMKPDNSISLFKIDGQKTGFFVTDTTKIQPGKHQLTFICTLNGNIFGKKEFTINALAGKTYYVSFPKYMHGYAIDLDACNKITMR